MSLLTRHLETMHGKLLPENPKSVRKGQPKLWDLNRILGSTRRVTTSSIHKIRSMWASVSGSLPDERGQCVIESLLKHVSCYFICSYPFANAYMRFLPISGNSHAHARLI